MVRIKSFGIVQTAKAVSVFWVVVLTPCYIAMGLMILSVGGISNYEAALIMSMPILGLVPSFVLMALLCFVYNRIAEKVGGIEVELEWEEVQNVESEPS